MNYLTSIFCIIFLAGCALKKRDDSELMGMDRWQVASKLGHPTKIEIPSWSPSEPMRDNELWIYYQKGRSGVISQSVLFFSQGKVSSFSFGDTIGIDKSRFLNRDKPSDFRKILEYDRRRELP